MKIKLSTSFPHWPLLLQTPGGSGLWNNVQFYVDSAVEECHAWFVYSGLTRPETTRCPRQNTVFVTGEPPSQKMHDPKWLQQFSHVISFRRDLPHSRVHRSHTGLPWHIGRSYDEFAVPVSHKSKVLSLIASTTDGTAGHRRRLDFVRRLRERSHIDVFGRGLRELPRKWEGLADYRYSIAIENCSYPDYWTEKIADCFLAEAIPFYYGCPNIGNYFPSDAFVWIDIERPDEALRKIWTILAEGDSSRRLAALQKAKNLVLNQYNLFNLLAEFSAGLDRDSRQDEIRLDPEP
jgi:hypothetical protein